MNAVTTHTLTSNIHAEHLPSVHKWKTPPCSPQDALEVGLYATGQKTVQTPKQSRRYAMENENSTPMMATSAVYPFSSPSVLTRYLLFSLLVFYLNWLARETQIKWCVLHSWIFRAISAHGTLIAPENSAASKPMSAKHSKIHSWPNATERTKHTRPVTFLLSEENISLVGF